MSTPVRVAAFVTALVAVFAAAVGAGRLVGPLDVAAAPAAHGSGSAHEEPHEDATGVGPVTDGLPGGLLVADGGYRLDLDDTTLRAGERVPLGFRITGPDGAPLTSYDVEHEKELHLIVVRRDLAGYQHIHPVQEPDGTWAVDVALEPGTWRVLADFTPAGGEGLTLGADVAVAGRFRPSPPAPERLTDTVDGYTLTLTGGLTPGGASDVTVEVSRDGEEVTDLEPYLGAFGHLVALREGDLAYLHVHPEQAGPGPRVPFVAQVPSAGRYRLFFDFQHDGVVRTASFVAGTGDDPAQGGGGSHDH